MRFKLRRLVASKFSGAAPVVTAPQKIFHFHFQPLRAAALGHSRSEIYYFYGFLAS